MPCSLKESTHCMLHGAARVACAKVYLLPLAATDHLSSLSSVRTVARWPRQRVPRCSLCCKLSCCHVQAAAQCDGQIRWHVRMAQSVYCLKKKFACAAQTLARRGA